jgi:hypothetical protein
MEVAMRMLLFAAATAALVATSPAVAQTGGDGADVRCLLVLQAIARDPKQQEQAGRGLYFYLGKLAARGASSRLEAVMLTEGQGLNSQPKNQAELTRCGAELNQQTNTLRAANTRIATRLGATPPTAE